MAVRSGRTPSSPPSSTSACRTTTSWPGAWSRTRSRTQPTRFCPKSTRVAPDGEEKTAAGQGLGDPDRRAVGRDQAGQVRVDDLDGAGAVDAPGRRSVRWPS